MPQENTYPPEVILAAKTLAKNHHERCSSFGAITSDNYADSHWDAFLTEATDVLDALTPWIAERARAAVEESKS